MGSSSAATEFDVKLPLFFIVCTEGVIVNTGPAILYFRRRLAMANA